MRSFDALVIGCGQAGPFLAARLVQAGRQVALFEREHLGGTCVNDGCMPTKTLLASARAAHVARRAADHGVLLGGEVRVDMAAVQARVQAVVQQSVGNLGAWLESMPGLTLVRGHARFTAPGVVAVAGQRYTAPQVFINVGGRPALPDWPGLAEMPTLTNTSALQLTELPAHLVVAGGSYIGLEFAQAFRRFGARVTVLEAAPRLVAREDAEVSQALQDLLEAEGVAVHTGVRDVQVRRGAGGGVQLQGHTGAGAIVVEGSHLLLATGRRPNTDDLGLQHAGIDTDARGFIQVDDELRTRVPGHWALGDCNGRGAFTHTAYHEHEVVATQLLGGPADAPRSIAGRITAYALFTDPPLARIGLTEAQVRASGRPALVGRLPMARVGRARERGETRGFMQVLVDAATRQILGATLFGIEADEVVHSLLNVMSAGLPCTVIQRSVPIHPTVSELIPTLLGSLQPLTPTLASTNTETSP